MQNLAPLAAANSFIDRAQSDGLTHMQLQKLVYLTHEDWVREHGQPFLSENPQVWQYGPVFAHLYHDLKHYKKARIQKPIELFGSTPRAADREVEGKIDAIWDKYKGKSGVYLSDITHMPGTPWRNIAKKYSFSVPYGLEIKPEDILAASK